MRGELGHQPRREVQRAEAKRDLVDDQGHRALVRDSPVVVQQHGRRHGPLVVGRRLYEDGVRAGPGGILTQLQGPTGRLGAGPRHQKPLSGQHVPGGLDQ